MQLSEMVAMMEQFKENGGDWNGLVNSVAALSATNSTPLGLSQWVQSDKPRMEEFNENNRIIDESIRELQAGVDAKADKSYVDGQLSTKVNANGTTTMTGPLKTTGVVINHGDNDNYPWAHVRFINENKVSASLISDKRGSVLLRVLNPANDSEYKDLSLSWNGNITWNGKKVLTE